MIIKSFVMAVIPMLLIAFGLAFAFKYYIGGGLKMNLVNAIPLCIISSAIAIPSVKNISAFNKEFVIYESSLSDIAGVLFFNFIALNGVINMESVGHFFLELLLILVISFLCIVMLSLLLSRIEHHVKSGPFILIIILIYAISKLFHLPGLLFILLFGLFLGNINEMRRFKWYNHFKPIELKSEVGKLKDITIEAAFIVRSLFFLVFGFLIEVKDLLNQTTFAWAFVIFCAIVAIRMIHIKILKLQIFPLLFIAPRGLITILLFLSIPIGSGNGLVNASLILQLIILSTLFMMIGLMITKKEPTNR